MPGSPGRLKLSAGAPSILSAGQQPAKDTDSTAQKQNATGHEQQRLTNDSGADLGHDAKDAGGDFTQSSEQSSHGVSSGSRRAEFLLSKIPENLIYLTEHPESQDSGKHEC